MESTTSARRRAARGLRSLAPILLLVPLAAAWPGPAAAQETGTLAGRVLAEEDRLPLAGARVSLEGGSAWAVTDDGGAFAFAGIPAGQVVLRIEREGFVSLVERVEVAPLETSLVQFQLYRIGALLDALLVTAARGGGRHAEGHSEGEIGGRDDGARTATDLLMRSVPGLYVARSGGSAGATVRVRLRGVNSISLSDQPAVYLDGVRIDDGGGGGGGGGGGIGAAVSVLDHIPAGQVSRIRVLRGPAAASGYANGAAGVILVETIRSRSPSGPR